MGIDRNKYIHHLNEVCSDYNMSASDVYAVLLNKNDENFPLDFTTVKHQVLKDVPVEILKSIFTLEELKNIFADTNVKKIKNRETRKFINTLI